MPKLNQYLGIVAAFAVVLANAALGFADDNADFEGVLVDSEGVVEVIDVVEEVKELEDLEVKNDAEDFLDRLKSDFSVSKVQYRQILNEIEAMSSKLNDAQDTEQSLSFQLDDLDLQIKKTQKKLFDVLKQVVEKENRIALIYDKIEEREIALEYQKELIKDYVSILYQQENNYLSFDDNGNVDAVKLLLSDGSVGEKLKEMEYFGLLNEAARQMLQKLDDLNKELVEYKEKIKKEKQKLQNLQQEIENEKTYLDMQKQSKENLLKVTKGQQEIYTQLLEQSMREQMEVFEELKSLDEVVRSVEEKIENGDVENFDEQEYMDLLDERTKAYYEFSMEFRDFDGFSWPVGPDRGISAYFHDSGYAGTFGMQHNAIDLPVAQGSLIRSAADGVVYTTADNGYGYSYIIVAHADGFQTLYGHISSILVDEGSQVSKGAILGLSGGMPGTKGAGYITTGPHLHFEILHNGIHVDPLEYLDMTALTRDQVDWLPEKYMEMWEEAALRKEAEAILR